jgi:hypothetical protein
MSTEEKILESHFKNNEKGWWSDSSGSERVGKLVCLLLTIMAPIGFSSYCTLKLLFSRVMVLPQV